MHPRAVSGSALQSQVIMHLYMILVLALFELQIFLVQRRSFIPDQKKNTRRSFIAFEGGERAFDNVITSIEIKSF